MLVAFSLIVQNAPRPASYYVAVCCVSIKLQGRSGGSFLNFISSAETFAVIGRNFAIRSALVHLTSVPSARVLRVYSSSNSALIHSTLFARANSSFAKVAKLSLVFLDPLIVPLASLVLLASWFRRVLVAITNSAGTIRYSRNF